MRDLFLLTHQRATLPHGRITTSTLDSVTSTLYVGTRDLNVIAWDLKYQQVKWTVPINGEDDELIPRADTFLSCTYLSEFESLHLITSMGHMLLLNVVTYDIEHVGSVPPVTATAWSPDQEIVTLATNTGTLFLMTKEWEVLYEIQIARDVTGLSSGSTPIITSLTWRGDGQYVAANVQVGDNIHLIVYNRDGECQSKSTSVGRDATGLTAGHSPLLTWRPSGNLITSSQRRIIGTTVKHEIIFYERNGLRHGEFILRGEDVKIWDICWNSDSEVLALIVQHPTTHVCSLQLWYQNNYHWYLKYQLDIPTTTITTTTPSSSSSTTSPILLCWDPEQAMRLCLIESETGSVRWMEFCFDVHASISDDRSVAVIDGTSLLLTPLARMVMPPPMSDHQLTLSSPIVSLSFYNHDVMILTSSRQIIYASDVETVGKSKYDLATLSLDEDEHFQLNDVRGLIWIQKGVNTHTLLLIESHLPTGSHVSRDMLIEMNVAISGEKMEMKEMMRTPVPEGVSVLRTYPRLSDHYIAVETTDGRVFKYNPTCYTTSIPSLVYFATLPTPCSWLGVTRMGDVELCVGRDIRSRLYIDQTLVSPQSLSFSLLHPRFLLFTVAGQQNAMFFLDREQSLEYNLAPETRMDPHAFRFVERGSSIVTVIPHHDRPRVVLQLPRGNLETISPRALTLASINTCLSNRDYHTALSTARTQRIDLNLLVDHNEDDFCNHAEEFVRSVDNVDHINLFLSSLTNENVIKTQFPGYKPLPSKDEKKEESPHFDDRDALEHNLTSTPSHDLMDIHDDDMDDAESHARHHNPHAKKGASEYAERKEREQRAVEYEAQLTNKNVKKYDDTSKINRVCRVVREALEKIDAKKFTLSILTCYVKSSPPNLPATLTLIKSMRDAERAQGIKTNTTLQKEQKEVSQRENKSHKYGSALGALKYVIFLCDVKQLYRVALSMYDFDLVMMVAQQSQRDPKEYLPMLKKMQDMVSTPYFQHYSIDLHLKRYDVACINLCEALKRQEIPSEYFTTHLLELIRKQRLYLIALHHLRPADITRLSRNIYAHGTSGVDTRAQRHAALAQLAMLGDPELPSTSHLEDEEEDVKTTTTTTTTSTTTTISQDTLTQYYLTVLSHYAEYQRSHGRTTQAAIAYGICGNIDACIHTWKDGGEYRQAMSLAYHNKWEHNKIQTLAYQLVTILQQQSRYIDAALVLAEYCDDVDQAVVVLLSAEEWSECLRVCYTRARADLIETHVQPELKKTYQRYIKHIAAQMKRYEYSTRRIRIVRRVKLMFPVMADVPHDDRDDDLQSIVSGFSNISSSTRASGVSGVSSILSQASRASSVVSTTSSIFSVIPQNYGTMTPEEKQQEKRLKRIARKRINKVVKEGHPQEEEHLMREIIDSTPTLKYQEKLQHLIRILIQFGQLTDAQQLDADMTAYSALVTREESIPMPMLPDPTPEQRAALLAFWNWPAAAHPAATDPLINTLENQRLDFLSNHTPTQYSDESQPRRHANSKRGKPKQRHGGDDEEEDDKPVVTQRKKEFWELDEDERAE